MELFHKVEYTYASIINKHGGMSKLKQSAEQKAHCGCPNKTCAVINQNVVPKGGQGCAEEALITGSLEPSLSDTQHSSY